MSAEQVGLEQGNTLRKPCAWISRCNPGDVGSMAKYNLDNDVVTLGCESFVVDAPHAAFSNEETLRHHLDQSELKSSDKVTANTDIGRFFFKMNIDEYVVLSPKEDTWIVIGRVTGEAIYDVGMPPGARLSRQVEWLTDKIPKDEAQIDKKKIDGRRWSVISVDVDQVKGAIRRFSDSGFMSGGEAGVRSDDDTEFPEGAKKRVEVDRYEKNPIARRRRLEHDDYTCQVCDLKFEDRYGEFARGYMHVHHVVPLSQITDHENHRVNPKNDLVAVCPNCHAMLHHHPDNPCTVETLRLLMAETSDSAGSG